MPKKSCSIKTVRFCAALFLIFAPLCSIDAGTPTSEWRFYKPWTWPLFQSSEKPKQPTNSITPQKNIQQTSVKPTIVKLMEQKTELVRQKNTLSANVFSIIANLCSLGNIKAERIAEKTKKEFLTRPLNLLLEIFNEKNNIKVTDQAIYCNPQCTTDPFTLHFKINPINTRLKTIIESAETERTKSDLIQEQPVPEHLLGTKKPNLPTVKYLKNQYVTSAKKAQKQKQENYKRFFNRDFEEILGREILYTFEQPNYKRHTPLPPENK